MSDPTTKPLSPDHPDQPDRQGLFFKKVEHDQWEAWVWSALGLFVSALLIWIVAFLKLGYTSIYAYSVGIPLTSFLAVPIILWGLVKTLLNPPIFRLSRNLGFFFVMATAIPATKPMTSAPVPTDTWRSSQTYQLPFAKDQTWYVLNGGADLERNALAIAPSSRFAYDFTVLKQQKRLPEGADAYELSSYHCFGQPVLSPVKGTVHKVLTDQADQVPGKTSKENFFGNYVILKVGQGEFLIVAFLKKDSISLKEGQVVQPGQTLGQCGNSGAASYPQVRMMLVQDGEQPLFSYGLPLRFDAYKVVGEGQKQDAMPLGAKAQGDTLSTGQSIHW